MESHEFPVEEDVTSVKGSVSREEYDRLQVLCDQKDQEIERMKTEFLSVASHQFRTPLTSMNWYLEMLLSDEGVVLQERERGYVEEVYATSRRMVGLVNDLLNVSRLETGNLELEPMPAQLETFLQTLVDEARPIADQAGATLAYAPPADPLPMVAIDKGMVRQVFSNLLTNAIKYSSSAGAKGKIDVSITQEGDEVIAAIQDNGIGIPEEAKPSIFSKFYRAENAIHAATDGSGLGLYIAHMVVTELGGRIWYESEVGTGTTFFVAFPCTSSSV